MKWLKLLLILAVLPLMIVFDAWAITIMWGWFIVPLGVVAIGKAHAYGISVMLSLFRNSPARRGENDRTGIELVIAALLTTGFMLLMGYIAHAVMT